MIREFSERDIDKVMDIWLNTNISAHNFIEEDYWKNNYIAGLFVEQAFQSTGIGSKLLSHLKILKSSLVLNVYEKNKLAVDFYSKDSN